MKSYLLNKKRKKILDEQKKKQNKDNNKNQDNKKNNNQQIIENKNKDNEKNINKIIQNKKKEIPKEEIEIKLKNAINTFVNPLRANFLGRLFENAYNNELSEDRDLDEEYEKRLKNISKYSDNSFTPRKNNTYIYESFDEKILFYYILIVKILIDYIEFINLLKCKMKI